MGCPLGRGVGGASPRRRRAVVPARVVLESQHIYRVHTGEAEVLARVTGRVRHKLGSREAFPAVGDWIALKPAAPGRGDGPHRRGPAASRTVRAQGRRDRHRGPGRRRQRGRGVPRQRARSRLQRAPHRALPAGGARGRRRARRRPQQGRPATRHRRRCAPNSVQWPARSRSNWSARVRGRDSTPCVCHIGPGRTAAFLGSSGVGKSTLINRLIGRDMQRTAEVRESDSKGRHTTTHRELVVLPGGGLLIDTPGHARAAALGRLDRARRCLRGHRGTGRRLPLP